MGNIFSSLLTSSASEVTVLFAQDALDADNFSSAVGACEVVKEFVRQGKKVHFVMDVQTACHDLRLPRFRGPMVERTMLSWAGAAAMSAEHQVAFVERQYSRELETTLGDDAIKHSQRVPDDVGICKDTELIQKLLTYMLHEVLTSETELVQYVKEKKVRLSYVLGDITEQGLWTPMVPNTFLFYDAVEHRMRTPDQVKTMTKKMEKEAWEASAPGEPDWDGYFPPKPTDGDKAKEERKDPVTAEATLPKVKQAFANLRESMRAQLATDIAACEARHAARRFAVPFRSGGDVLDELRASGDDVYMMVCAPAGFTWNAYSQIQRSQRGTARVKLVTGCVLTWDGADNLVGHQWNEYLEIPSMRKLMHALQRDEVPSIFTPTQLFKAPLKNMDTSAFNLTSTALSQRMHDAAMAELNAGPAPGTGFTMLGYQGLWNDAKFGPQAIFDPLSVFFTLQYVRALAGGGSVAEVYRQAGVRLLAVTLDDELEILQKKEGCKGGVLVPHMFDSDDAREWWEFKARMDSAADAPKPVVKSPFTPEVEAEFTATINRWYRLKD
eukprot:CAMPEP_0196716904 /NCGR_PEP_ID=MMETSP1091-20130531/336_1 /TAXON_ID=302021 /ORGANISM="Rhodomonas sp., Strain CCMP768" /LENGTH=553 /DNA_ID=CAMNT_0042057093 /DNA_START=34 /DNA_END=1695 /DNA_ORIENTATION=+